MLSSKLNHKLDKPLGPLVRWLARIGISPNMLTVAGAIMNIAAAAALLYGHFRVGSALIIVGGLCDLLDGALARVTGMQSRFGNVLDSTLDRYSDILPLSGLLLYYSGWHAGGTRFGDMVLCSVVIVGTFLVPYVRAKAESLATRCDVGLAERAERIIILAGGLMVGAEVAALWVLAVLTHVTVIHRLLHVRSQTAGRFDTSAPGEPHDAELVIRNAKGEL
jgi:phosphatidylglycerophosphate synthase